MRDDYTNEDHRDPLIEHEAVYSQMIGASRNAGKPWRTMLLASAFLAFVGILGYCGWLVAHQQRPTATQTTDSTARIRAAVERQKYDAALQLAVEGDKVGETLNLIGEQTLGGERATKLLIAYEDVLRSSPEQADVRRRLVPLAIRLDRSTTALAHLDTLITDFPEESDLVSLRAAALKQVRKYGDAAKCFRDAVLLAPKSIGNYVELVRLINNRTDDIPLADLDPDTEGAEERYLLEDPDPTDIANRWLDQMVEEGKPSYLAYLHRAQFHRLDGEIEEARQDLEDALQRKSDDPNVLFEACIQGIVRLPTTDGDEDAAKLRKQISDWAVEGQVIAPSDFRFAEIRALLALSLSEETDALEILEEALTHVEENETSSSWSTRLLWLAAHCKITNALRGHESAPRMLSAAEEDVTQLRESLLRPTMHVYLSGLLALARSEWSVAYDALDRARRDFSRMPLLMRQIDIALAQCSQQLIYPERQIVVLLQGVNEAPLWTLGRRMLSSSFIEQGQFQRAVEELRRANVEGDQTRIAALQIAEVLSLPIGSRDWTEIGMTVPSEDDDEAWQHLQAEVLGQRKEHDTAIQRLQKAIERDPENSLSRRIAVAMLTADQATESSVEDAIQQIRGLSESNEPTAELLVAEAQLCGSATTDESLARLSELESQAETLTSRERSVVLEEIALSYARRRQFEELKSVTHQLALNDSSKLARWLELARWSAVLNDLALFDECISQIESIEGSDGLYQRIVTAVDSRDNDGSASDRLNALQTQINEAAAMRPDWYGPMHVLGALQARAARVDDAFESLQKSIQMGNRSAAAIEFVAATLARRGKTIEARKMRQRLASAGQPESNTIPILRDLAFTLGDSRTLGQQITDRRPLLPRVRSLIRPSQIATDVGQLNQTLSVVFINLAGLLFSESAGGYSLASEIERELTPFESTSTTTTESRRPAVAQTQAKKATGAESNFVVSFLAAVALTGLVYVVAAAGLNLATRDVVLLLPGVIFVGPLMFFFANFMLSVVK